MNGAQWLVKTLKNCGVEHIFTLCGNGLFTFHDACLDHGMNVIDVRNEQCAAYMADLWGRFTGRLGVCVVSSGPGHTNALTGLANSWWDGGPMLLISGSSASGGHGMDNFQDLDQVAMTGPITKYSAMIHSIGTLEHETRTAIATAVSGRPGPVHLTIPAEVFAAEIDEQKLSRRKLPPGQVRQSQPADADLIREAATLIRKAKRPFIVAGNGAFYPHAGDALAGFAELTDIPIVSHIWDRGCVQTALPQYMGVTNDELNHAMQHFAKADVILLAGARADYRVGYCRQPAISKNTRIIRIDNDPAEINRVAVPDIGIVGDARSALEQMAEEVRRQGAPSNANWLKRVRKTRDRLVSKWDKLGCENVCPVPSIRIIREIKQFLDDDVTFLLDGGNIGRWAHMMLFDRHPSHWFTCGASGVVGWGVPGAVAAKLARPEKPVLLLSGDGSAGFTLADIQTALRFNTPYVAVVAHDGAWGIVADGQADGRHVASEFGLLRFDLVATALGARGIYIEDPRQIAPSIEASLEIDTVTFIHVPTQLAGISQWEARFGSKRQLGDRDT